MMQQIGLPNRSVLNTESKRNVGVDATIQLCPSKHQLSNELSRKSISIYVYENLEEAEDWLENEAIRFMEVSYNKVVQDFNYDKFQLVQQKINL